MTILGDISAEQFLKEYWQKRPLLIRGAFLSDPALISPEELAGYSLDDDIESRLIIQQEQQWQLEHGPFDESSFAKLPASHWTLLVQSLDYFHPPLRQLIKACNFIPRWRLDDVMVSFATDGGGVGPHLDKYDVFLIQGEGQRRWRVGHSQQAVVAYQPHPQIAQIEPFEPSMDVVVEPGDLLYIPPNTPHWGESIGNSLCYSVGFRAPSIGSIINKLAQLPESDLDRLWEDGGKLTPAKVTGQLDNNMAKWAASELQQLWHEADYLKAFAASVTELKYPELLELPSQQQVESWMQLSLDQGIAMAPLARITYVERTDELWLFINGEFCSLSATIKPIIDTLNLQQQVAPEELQQVAQNELKPLLQFALSVGGMVPASLADNS